MVITETPRSLAISFIRVLMDGYSVYRTSVPDMDTTTLAPRLTAFSLRLRVICVQSASANTTGFPC